jgi:hypothetical protein
MLCTTQSIANRCNSLSIITKDLPSSPFIPSPSHGVSEPDTNVPECTFKCIIPAVCTWVFSKSSENVSECTFQSKSSRPNRHMPPPTHPTPPTPPLPSRVATDSVPSLPDHERFIPCRRKQMADPCFHDPCTHDPCTYNPYSHDPCSHNPCPHGPYFPQPTSRQ